MLKLHLTMKKWERTHMEGKKKNQIHTECRPAIVYFDLRSAFDNVKQPMLFEKLKNYISNSLI